MSDAGPTLWSTALRACLAGFAALGLDADRIRREAGIERAALADPDGRIPFALTARVWPAAQAQWGKRGLGLHTGVALPIGELGAMDYVLPAAATVRDGLEEMARVFRVVSHGATRFELERAPSGDALLRFTGVFPPEVRDYSLGAYVARLRHVGVTPAAVSFTGPPFDEERAYERQLGVRAAFGSAANELRLRAEELDRPRSDDRYRGLRPIVGREIERLLGDVPLPSAGAEARRVVARLLPSGNVEGDAVARAMSTSLRTLQRRLADEGTSLRALVEATREELAVAYLDQGRLGVAEIAYLVGYTEPGTFTTAFKRWTGRTPSEHRRRRAGS